MLGVSIQGLKISGLDGANSNGDKEEGALADGNASSSSLPPRDMLICSTKGNVYALRKHDGRTLWKVQSPTGTAMSGILSIFVVPDPGQVIVAGGGKTACLDIRRGSTIWINNMVGCGYEAVGLTMVPNRYATPAHGRMINGPTVATPEEQPPGYDEATQASVVVACTNRKCLGISLQTGRTLWRFDCPGGGHDFPSALVDHPNVYVGCAKHVYCLEARTGAIVWTRKISKALSPGGSMVMATAQSSQEAAYTNTSFNQFPVPQVYETAE